jgi:adenylate cyclase
MAAIDRLIVTLAAEVVGYSKLIRADEKGTLEQLEAHRHQFVYPKIAEHSGRIVRAIGDNLLVEFESATEAVRCAAELQSGMIGRSIRTLPDRRITFRIGVSSGQVTANGDDLVTRAVAALPRDTLATLIKPGAEVYLGRGNMAVRLAWLAEPAGICISGAVRDAIRDRLPYLFKDIGKQNLEIGAPPVHCYALNVGDVASGPRLAAHNSQRRPMRLRTAAVALGVFAAVGVCGVALWVWLAANSSTAPIRAPVTAGPHAPPVGTTADLLATPNSGAAVVRGKQEASALQITPDSGAAVVRGNQAPSAPEIAPDGPTDVIRGTRVFSRAPLSSRPDQR